MYRKDARTQLISEHASVLSSNGAIRNSQLLQTYATFCAMNKLDNDPNAAFSKLLSKYSNYPQAIRKDYRPPFTGGFIRAIDAFSAFSLDDFLTYIVPGTVCDPQRLISVFQKDNLGNDPVILVHHIIQIRLVAYRIDSGLMKQWGLNNQDGYDDILDKIYAYYCTLDKIHYLPKPVFLRLYSAINTFHLDQHSLSAHTLGFKNKDISDLTDILTDQLQMTRSQQIEMVYRVFIRKEQASHIIHNQSLYNFVACKDEKTRITLATKAIRLITKISPLELLCAITSRKKAVAVNLQKCQESLILPNDVPLETGVIFPILKTNFGVSENEPLAILFPSIHFVRKVLQDPFHKNRAITFVFQDEMIAQLLQYQFDKQIYAPRVGSQTSTISYSSFLSQHSNTVFAYKHIVFFGNTLGVEQQQAFLRQVLTAVSHSTDIYALLSTYAIDSATSPLLHTVNSIYTHIDSMVLIPQGINNSTYPKRKIWIHCRKQLNVSPCTTKVYALSLNTSMKTQAVSPMMEAPLVCDQDDILTFDSSIRSMYAQEMLLRRASGRERNMAFSYEFTPDILIWVSRSYPKDNQNRPRLEAYVCSPSPDKNTSRGAIIPSTKKRTTNIEENDVLKWIESDYPFSSVRGRYTPEELESLGGSRSLKPMISIREEIITNYVPALQNKNIALKTLWYLYPNLQDRFSNSDYILLSEMMQTAIGQQFVADLDAEKCEQLLMDAYPNLSQTALWHYYGIISTTLDFAASLDHCPRNLLKEALHQVKVRDKLFAQVRKVMVKKHFSEQEMLTIYQYIQLRIQKGETEYFGVLIRLLTGLESNVVCALRWCDLRYIPDYDVMTFVITRQLSFDGTKSAGFSDAEDYLCFPIPRGLRADLEKYQKQIKNSSQNRLILSSIASFSKKSMVSVTPKELNSLTKKVISQLQIDERIIALPDTHDGVRFTNMNKYSGDLIRENFRYWATKVAKLNADELSYLLRNKCPSTLGRFYCDFLGDSSQLIMSAKLSRWEASMCLSASAAAQRYAPEITDTYTTLLQSDSSAKQEIIYEVFGSGHIDASIHSDYGIDARMIKIECKEVSKK